MKKYILALFLAGIFQQANAQNEIRNLADFNSLKISSAFNVEIKQGTSNQVEISGVSSEYLSSLITEVDGELLHIYAKNKIKADKNMNIRLTFKNLKYIEINGASTLTNLETLDMDQLQLKTSGASQTNLLINTRDMRLEASGASDVNLRGKTINFSLIASGASDIDAKEFFSENVTISESGASDVIVWVKNEITGSVSGASDIKIVGQPEINQINSSGSSTSAQYLGEINFTDTINEPRKNRFGGDTTSIRFGRTNLLITNDTIKINRKPKKRRNHWAGIDLGINGFMNNQGSFNLNHDINLAQTSPKKVTQFMELDYAKSWVFNLNFMEYFFKINEHHVGFVTGLGLEYNNYELKHNVRLIEKGGSYTANTLNNYNENYTWGIIDSATHFSKNRFKTFYVTAPLLFEINTGNDKNKSFHFSAGAIVAYKFTTRMKYIYEVNGNEQKVKDDSDFNTNPFKISLTARTGVGWFNVFATYSVTPLFESGKGPELYPFTVGITLLGF